MTQEPPACCYKILPCVRMVHASPHGRYRTSAACCCRRLWWQMLLLSEEKTKRSHEYSIADVSRPLGHCQEPRPDCLDWCALVPACQPDCVDTRVLNLASTWVTKCEGVKTVLVQVRFLFLTCKVSWFSFPYCYYNPAILIATEVAYLSPYPEQ